MYVSPSGSPFLQGALPGPAPFLSAATVTLASPSLPGSHCVAKPSGQRCVPRSLGCSASPGSAGHALLAKTHSPIGSEAPLPSCSSSLCSAAAPSQLSDSPFLISLPSNDGMPPDCAPDSSLLYLLSPAVLACRHVKSPPHADRLCVPVSSLDLIPDSRLLPLACSSPLPLLVYVHLQLNKFRSRSCSNTLPPTDSSSGVPILLVPKPTTLASSFTPFYHPLSGLSGKPMAAFKICQCPTPSHHFHPTSWPKIPH